ncbi:hypothetical protein, partial [Nocardia abscessus]|uniref:hypothetical protein n=1 Tax=Nocardia abscessus TaxID=120957 RepID=UPI002456F5D1
MLSLDMNNSPKRWVLAVVPPCGVIDAGMVVVRCRGWLLLDRRVPGRFTATLAIAGVPVTATASTTITASTTAQANRTANGSATTSFTASSSADS